MAPFFDPILWIHGPYIAQDALAHCQEVWITRDHLDATQIGTVTHNEHLILFHFAALNLDLLVALIRRYRNIRDVKRQLFASKQHLVNDTTLPLLHAEAR